MVTPSWLTEHTACAIGHKDTTSGTETQAAPREIALSQGRFAIVDEADYQKYRLDAWHFLPDKYAIGYACGTFRCNGIVKTGMMHRLIMGLPAKRNGLDVDHINGNGLDNRRCNLRICARGQNRAHCHKPVSGKTSQYKGVCWHKRSKRWYAQIGTGVSGHPVNIGTFQSEEDAARAYNAAAAERYGEFARLNIL